MAVLIRGRRDVQGQDELLSSKTVEELFLQLGRCSAELAERGSKRRGGDGVAGLLRGPLRWVRGRRGSEGKEGEKEEGEQEEEDSLADLKRVSTWPPGLKMPSTDTELREARKLTRAINKQIRVDGYAAKWRMLSVMLISPYCSCRRADHETKLRLVDGLASQSTNAKLEAASKVNLPGIREAVRRNIIGEAKQAINHLWETGTLGEEMPGLCDVVMSATSRPRRTLHVDDEEMSRLLGDLWKSDRFQEALREKGLGSRWYNDL